jgi:hypothetical protein
MIFVAPMDGTRCHVLFFTRALYSSFIASHHLEWDKASSMFFGSPDVIRYAHLTVSSVYTLDFLMLFCRRVVGRVEAGAADPSRTENPEESVAKSSAAIVSGVGAVSGTAAEEAA